MDYGSIAGRRGEMRPVSRFFVYCFCFCLYERFIVIEIETE